MTANPYREIPSVDELVNLATVHSDEIARSHLAELASSFQAEIRIEIGRGRAVDRAEIFARFQQRMQRLAQPRLAPVINATGVLIHTNLGRAPVSAATADAMRAAAAANVSLELDPETNERGGRMDEIRELMRILAGAESALVVNNNAAAVLLTLSALAPGKSVVVSRGEAIEIGGGFRIPEVLRQSGAELVEVGTTNRTYPADYQAVIDERTALLLKVHASNFEQRGFVEMATIAQLAPIARAAGIPIVEDLGSGSLLQPADYGLGEEPTIAESLQAGADIVTASGDKLLGGPQAGIIVGRAELVARIERHPLARAVRADKTALAGIAATLRHYLHGDAVGTIPVWQMISAPVESLRRRGEAILAGIGNIDGCPALVESQATVGGGSLPGQELPSIALAISSDRPVDEVARRFRTGEPRVFGRIEAGVLRFDLRSVLPEQDEALKVAISALLDRDCG